MSQGGSNYPRRNRRKTRLRGTRARAAPTRNAEQAATVQQMETHYPSLQIRDLATSIFRQLT